MKYIITFEGYANIGSSNSSRLPYDSSRARISNILASDIKIGDYVKLSDKGRSKVVWSKHKNAVFFVNDISIGFYCLYEVDENYSKTEIVACFSRDEIEKLTEEEMMPIIAKKYNL